MFTQKDAQRIARKLNAKIQTGRRAHDIVQVEHEGRLVASYGIRRASREKSHGHIPDDLHLKQKDARALADCPLSAQQYFELLREKGLL